MECPEQDVGVQPNLFPPVRALNLYVILKLKSIGRMRGRVSADMPVQHVCLYDTYLRAVVCPPTTWMYMSSFQFELLEPCGSEFDPCESKVEPYRSFHLRSHKDPRAKLVSNEAARSFYLRSNKDPRVNLMPRESASSVEFKLIRI